MKTGRQRSINIVTLGCSKNLADSESLMGQLSKRPVRLLHDSNEDSDAVVINTCGFIADAKEESIDTILQFVEAKKQGKVAKVFVMGCLSERYKTELESEIDMVDGFYGTNQLEQVMQALELDFKKELLGERYLTGPGHYAYLKISEGCDRSCSFCAIPSMRGRHKSRSIPELIGEASLLAAKGVKELILIAQDLTYYGLDLYNSRMLPRLIEQLSMIPGIHWIRLHYTYPAAFPMQLIDVMRSNPKLCNYMDMPIQHINTRILGSMRRKIDRNGTLKLLDTIRKELPEVALRTTLITGYPGETDKEFSELLDFVKEYRFERLGVFTYSHEEGTRAYQLEDDVPEDIKQARKDELMEIQSGISAEINASLVGKKLKVLIDGKESGHYIGRTEWDSPEVDNEVIISSHTLLDRGDFTEVEITEASDYDLFAKITQ